MSITFTSTADSSVCVSLQDAVLKNISKDGGLFVPSKLPKIQLDTLSSFSSRSFSEVAVYVLGKLFDGAIDELALTEICERAFPFDIGLTEIHDALYALELFHGPTYAFKDFGVRFLAELLSYYHRKQQGRVTILTATSGDTGGAVADAFHNREGFDVFVLYPSKKVSDVQELQIAGLGNNINAIEVNGTFDDCQRMVKEALRDEKLARKRTFASANSINVARLLPQMCYYARAWTHLPRHHQRIVRISVPSGNFGNVTAALYAKRIGVPIGHIIAATNSNDVVPRYFQSGLYQVNPFKETLSTAMDIADPNNFKRTLHLAEGSLQKLKEEILAISIDDIQTMEGIRSLHRQYGYVTEPHAAVAYEALIQKKQIDGAAHIFVATAHPWKFKEIVQSELGIQILPPKGSDSLLLRKKQSTYMEPKYSTLQELLLASSP